MSEKTLLDRWASMMKVAPEDEKVQQKSWNDKNRNLLSTERKIYAIKINDREMESIHCFMTNKKKKKTKILLLKKWLSKCEWTLPRTIVLFSLLQIFFHLIKSTDLTYQTLAFSPTRKCEIWRFLTYSLLHAGTAHLVINIVLQLVIALPLESEVGHLNIIVVYVGGILSGSLAASVTPDFSLMVGASSGIYSLLMSNIPHIYMNFASISHRTHRIIFVVVLTMSDVIYALIHCLENREPQIAIRSHIAGALSGILLGFMFYQSHRQENRDEDLKFKILKWTSTVCFLSIIALAVTINVM